MAAKVAAVATGTMEAGTTAMTAGMAMGMGMVMVIMAMALAVQMVA
jgi:hypothetical protein